MKRKKLSKWALIWRSSKEFVVGYSGIIALALIIFIIGGITHHTALSTMRLLLGAYCLMMFLLAFLVVSTGIVKGLFLLHRQEKIYHFRFSSADLDENDGKNVWYISTDFYLLAFHRGFICKTGEIQVLSGWGRSKMLFWDCEGKKHSICAKYMDLKSLKEWLKEE